MLFFRLIFNSAIYRDINDYCALTGLNGIYEEDLTILTGDISYSSSEPSSLMLELLLYWFEFYFW
jgi:hypothetical protein